LGDRKDILPVNKWVLVVTIWSFARLIAPVVSTTSIILSYNEVQIGDVLVVANPDPSGKWRK